MNLSFRSPCVALLVLLLAGCQSFAPQPSVPLVTARQTSYAIVLPASASTVDRYAADELALYLKQMSGAGFPIIEPEAVKEQAQYLFLGTSQPMRQRLGEMDPLAGFEPQQHVNRSVGGDIFLYGEGIHGNLYAAMMFLEESLGWRWYTVFEAPVLPDSPTLVLSPFERTRTPSFRYRKLDMQRGMDHFYQQGINQGLDKRVKLIARKVDPEAPRKLAAFVSAIPEADNSAHTLFSYIPPTPTARGADRFEWIRKDYFDTHPEYFSLWSNGQRVPNKQLCFSNQGLRRALTHNLLEHLRREGDDVLMAISAMDVPGDFCYCEGCHALVEQYQSPGGPIYDYVIDFCHQLAESHPGSMMKLSAYRRSQTQIPPTLPDGELLPDNLIIDFCPIEDSYFSDFTHPDPRIQGTLADLREWGRLTAEGNLWAWLYPNGWGTGFAMPVGDIQRLITNLRIMRDAGVQGIFMNQLGYHQRGNNCELQAYLFFKLGLDVEADTQELIREFTDYLYGPAGAGVRQYYHELEAGRLAMRELPEDVRTASKTFELRIFPYLTTANIHRWQQLFDRLETTLDGRPQRERNNLRLLRRELDLATLWRWFDLQEAYPDAYEDHEAIVSRIRAANQTPAVPAPEWEDRQINRRPLAGPSPDHLITLIQAGGETKPLPPSLAALPEDQVRQLVPRLDTWLPEKRLILDEEAAFGYGVPVYKPDLPFTCGFYRQVRRTNGPRLAIEKSQIDAGVYQLFEIGEIDITPDCLIWFSARSWQTQLDLSPYFEPDGSNRWTAYVSLKFLGPTYGDELGEALLPAAKRDYLGTDPTDLVLVDRVILVRQD